MQLKPVYRPRLWVYLLAVGLAAPGPLAAKRQESGLDAESKPANRPQHSIPKTQDEIAVDGELTEAAWNRAMSVSLDYETRPGENTEPPVQTECLMTHDDENLYVAFRAHDPNPDAIRAHLSDRDQAWSDDFVGVVLDTFNDERRAFEFFVNPLGVQMDLFQDDLSGNEDSSWDAIWNSAGKIGEEGYVVEMAIPFNQLRFPRSEGMQTWGFDALRFYPRSDRHRISVHPLDRDVSCYLCQASKVTGFESIAPGKNVELVPTITSARTDENPDFPEGDLVEGDANSEVGFTATWGVTPNMILGAAINPDFSQIEADVAQLDVNTQFALFFPERRPFFLEGADFFDTPMNAVFTRNVADPNWGLKLTGKEGKNAMGVFVAEDDITNLLLPGAQGSDSTSLDMKTLDSVVRYRRDFGESSALGALFTGRSGDEYSNGVAGFDGLYRFTDSNSARFQFLHSSTEYPLSVVEEFDQPEGSFSDSAIFASLDHNSRNWNAWARYQDIGTNFRADMGFMPRGDRELILFGGSHVWWGEEDDWYNRISLGGDWDRTEDQTGQLLEEEAEIFFNVSGPRQSFLWLGPGQRTRVFEGVTFDEKFVNSYFEVEPSGNFFFGMFAGVGDTIDFANVRPADQLILEPSLRYNFGLRLKARLSHEMQQLDVDGGRLFEANLTQLRLIYQFNTRMFFRTIFQYTDIQRNPELYIDEVDERFERLFTELLFSYKLNPRTVFFLGYSDAQEGDQDIELTDQNRSIFLKIGYAWVL